MTMRPSGRSAARGVFAIWRAGVQFVGHPPRLVARLNDHTARRTSHDQVVQGLRSCGNRPEYPFAGLQPIVTGDALVFAQDDCEDGCYVGSPWLGCPFDEPSTEPIMSPNTAHRETRLS